MVQEQILKKKLWSKAKNSAIKWKHTDKKENKIFLIFKEIQKGVFAKSYTIWLTASSYMTKAVNREDKRSRR